MAVDIQNIAHDLESRLFNATRTNVEGKLYSVLHDLGVLVGGQRSYIFLFDAEKTALDSAIEWCAPGTEGHDFSTFRGVPLTAFPWSMAQFREGQVVQVNDPALLPEEAAPERQACSAMGIESYVNLPLFVDGELTGWLGFDACDAPRTWSPPEIAGMQAAGALMMKTIARQGREATLARQQEASSRLATLGMIVSSVRHELQTPLACARANIEVLLESYARDHHTREILDETLEALEQITTLSQDLGSLKGQETDKTSHTDITDAVSLALRMTRVQNQRTLPIELALEHGLEAVCSKSRLSQVLINIISNAIQALHTSNTGDRMTIRTRGEHTSVIIEVEDNGPGIPAKIAQRLFTPFATTKQNGTGLGLALSKSICEAMGGSFDVSAIAPHGTRVRVVLPRAISRKNVLIVDDEPMILRSWARALGHYNVITASSATKALSLIEQGQRIDCVITDLHMPDKSGLWLIEQIKTTRPDLFNRIALFTGSYPEEFEVDPPILTLSKTISIAHMRASVAKLCEDSN